MEDSRNTLSFSFLDDLALAAARRRDDPAMHLQRSQIHRLGPLIELLGLHRSGLLSFDALPLCNVRQALMQALLSEQSGRGTYTTANGATVGFIATSRNAAVDSTTEDELQWLAFCRKAQTTAEMSLPKPLAQGLVGAMREIEENIHLHSQRPHDGVVGYRGTADEFEFVVADSGIGMLASLRQSPDYADLTDSGRALRLALQDGQSRLRYLENDHGYGFRNLFRAIANLNGELRFRSDDHAITISGVAPELVNSELNQKTHMRGFSASIVCRPCAAVK